MSKVTTATSRAGVAIIYVCVVLVAMIAIASFAVDFGRVQLAKTQLQTATDASARFAGLGLTTSSALAKSNAKSVASSNTVDGVALTLLDSDIEIGVWSAGAFTVTATSPDAVRITSHRMQSRGTGIPMTIASVLGRNYVDMKSVSVAEVTPGYTLYADVPADSNPWLAGMPSNTKANVGNPANNPDKAPAQSPYLVTGIALTPGQILNFDTISGTGSNSPGGAATGPDGDPNGVVSNFAGSENGMSDLKAPINSFIAVFLDGNKPSTTAAPANLDFSTAASRDFTSLSPALKQPFFIGDGRTSSGQVQNFVVPAGATRLFLASMDAYEWNNNTGSRTLNVIKPDRVALVK